MIRFLACKLTSFFIKKEWLDESLEDWCIYMLQRKLTNFLLAPVLIVFGAFKDSLLCSLFFWVSCVCIKKRSGGFHLKSETQCFLFSVSTVLVVQFFIVPYINDWHVVLLLLLFADILLIVVKSTNHHNLDLTADELSENAKKMLSILVILNYVNLAGLLVDIPLIYPTYSVLGITVAALSAAIAKITTREKCYEKNYQELDQSATRKDGTKASI